MHVAIVLVVHDYASAVSVERGRCFRWVYDEQWKPDTCAQPAIASGWLQVGTSWQHVDSCSEHSAQLRNRSSLARP